LKSRFNNDQEEKQWYEDIRERLEKTMNQAFPGNNGFFAKTSSRSAKDACIFKRDFFDIYKNELSKFSDPTQENARIITLLTPAFLALQVMCAADVLQMFVISESIYQNMLLATEAQNPSDDLFKENIILLPFIPIDIDIEFCGFVFQQRLTCLSRYNYLIYSQRLCQVKEIILENFIFFHQFLINKSNEYKSDDYLVDFALTKSRK
jgi:hypothetical protein